MPPRAPQPAALMGAVLISLTAAAALHTAPLERPGEHPVATPLLHPPILCMQPHSAARRAHDLARAAEAKLDDRRVIPGSGPRAWSMWMEAALCSRAAGDGPLAARYEARAAALRETLEADHRLRQLRLQQALELGELEDARSESLDLLALRGPRTDAYDIWLRRIAEGAAP